MPIFTAQVRVVHIETWEVLADNEAEARKKMDSLDKDVADDDSGGEIIDWEIESIRELSPSRDNADD